MLKRFVRIVGGDPNQREIESLSEIASQISELESSFEALSDEGLSAKTTDFRERLANGETFDDLLVEAYATVRETSKRTIGLRHYDIQLIGGIALHQGKIVEMRTGEGKTLVATLPLYLNGLTGKGVHLVTVNDYLARRDARWMAPIFNMLGLSVGVLQMAARTESGKKGFLVDLNRQSPHEDQDQLVMVPRRKAYAADITYGTNNEFGFDYLRDNMTMRLEDRVQRDFNFAIIDEVDNVLIDEARTPLIISGPAQDDTEWYLRMSQIVKKLKSEDYEINEKDRSVFLTEIGESHTEELLGIELRDPDRPEDITPQQARLLGYLEQALRAQFLFRRNKDYLVQAGKVVIIDEFTGRLMPGRRWSDGLHQAVEAKEGAKVQSESVTYATVTIQNYFRMYEKLSGMTGTALTEAEEFNTIYQLDVLAIPTNLEYKASLPESDLDELVDTDENGYKYTFYTYADDPDQDELFWKRKDFPDVVYRTEEAKLRAITQEILRYHVMGRPMLVGTTSVELSDRVSSRLRTESLRTLAQILLLRDAWIEQNYGEHDGRVIPELQFLNNPLDKIQTAELRKMARELNIPLNPADPINADRLISILNVTYNDRERIINSLQAGIAHQVLNARKHTEESQIIAGAGAFGAVTIATNMAGRGVDIKLGGELAEEIYFSVNRVLKRAGYKNTFEMTMEERRQALLKLESTNYGIYETEINFYLQHMNEMEQVRKLGGLHVIGSERHEARRIDNQLRGRSARQGDPGSSRFYLSMEDELMRLFGGQQADGLMQRMKIDDALPLEVGLVGRLIEQSQTRVEGANFDVRKHLLEYDDVLNTQRERIYSQRNRIFIKDDLHDDVSEMLFAEIERRVPDALEDEEGPWKLLAWLDQIQPPITGNGQVHPPFSLQLLIDDLINQLPENSDHQAVQSALVEVARNAVDAEKVHLLTTVNKILDQTFDRYETQLSERIETLDTFFEGLSLSDETDTRHSADILADLSNALNIPVKLSTNEQRELMDDPDQVYGIVHDQVELKLYQHTAIRLVGAIERRLGDSLDLSTRDIKIRDWDDLSDQVLNSVNTIADKRMVRLLGEDGQITKDLNTTLSKVSGPITEPLLLQLLLLMPQGARTVFDKKTHRRVQQRTIRLTYIYYATEFLEKREQEEITEMVLNHLEDAQTFMGELWGAAELGRLANSTMAELDQATIDNLESVLGDEHFSQYAEQPLSDLPEKTAQATMKVLGRRALSEIYRQLLLSVITEQWVEYLTEMEALRVSIGLEAYARQDPLVQYKNRAYELFQNLMANIRIMVVTRMFTYRPRDISRVQTGMEKSEVLPSEATISTSGAGDPGSSYQPTDEATTQSAQQETTGSTTHPASEEATKPSKKRRRRRRRK